MFRWIIKIKEWLQKKDSSEYEELKEAKKKTNAIEIDTIKRSAIEWTNSNSVKEAIVKAKKFEPKYYISIIDADKRRFRLPSSAPDLSNFDTMMTFLTNDILLRRVFSEKSQDVDVLDLGRVLEFRIVFFNDIPYETVDDLAYSQVLIIGMMFVGESLWKDLDSYIIGYPIMIQPGKSTIRMDKQRFVLNSRMDEEEYDDILENADLLLDLFSEVYSLWFSLGLLARSSAEDIPDLLNLEIEHIRRCRFPN